jgi:Outer membrane protein/protective antigen OMA87
VLKDEYLERDTNAIAAFGLNEGYVDIQVAAPTVEYRDDGIYITFNVHEGPRYTVRDVVFAGDVIDSEDKMLEVVQMDDWKKSDKYFSLTVMQEDSKRLTDYYSDYGYAFAEVDTKVVKADDGSDQVDVGYVINKSRRSSSAVCLSRAIPKPATTSSCAKCAWATATCTKGPSCAAPTSA